MKYSWCVCDLLDYEVLCFILFCNGKIPCQQEYKLKVEFRTINDTAYIRRKTCKPRGVEKITDKNTN